MLVLCRTISDRSGVVGRGGPVRQASGGGVGVSLLVAEAPSSAVALWRARDGPQRIFNAMRAVLAETGVIGRTNRRVVAVDFEAQPLYVCSWGSTRDPGN